MGRALYRKYRPSSLSEIIGQEHISAVLEKSIKNQAPSHAYLFIGPRGTGKTSVARIFAHSINHFEYKIESEHLDIIEIDAASNTGVDNIRELREKAIVTPSYGKYKVYIIDEVHMLSKSAFNALLKTLEEPPAHVIFIMATTDAHKVPITITSRSQVFTFKLADNDTIQKHLRFIADQEKIKISDDALKVIAHRGGGSFRDSISLLDQISTLSTKEITSKQINQILGLPSDELVTQLLNYYSSSDLDAITNTLKNLNASGVKAENIAENLILKIIEKPESSYLKLLDKLTEVARASFPEVKLLLALAENPTSKNNLEVPNLNLAPTPAPTSTPISTSTLSTPAQDPEPEQSPNKILDPSSTNFWSQLLQSVKQANSLLGSNLEQCDFELKNKQLTIYANKPFYKNRLEKNKGLVLSQLPDDFNLTILPNAKPSTDPTISAIADIMGGGEEVNVNI